MIFQNLFAKMAGKFIGGKLDLQEGTAMETKKWYRSKTMWSDLATIAVGIIGFVDMHFTGGKIATNPMYQTVLVVLGGVGIYGRKNADTKIG